MIGKVLFEIGCVLGLMLWVNAQSDKFLASSGVVWDCFPATCDKSTSNERNVFAAQYAPQNPSSFGGAVYGEQLWMTGSFSPAVTEKMKIRGSSSCGKCLLVNNFDAVNSQWRVIVMKKDECPSSAPYCAGSHINLKVPAFTNSELLTGMKCSDEATTFISTANAILCNDWDQKPGATSAQQCSCDSLPEDTAEQKMMKRGCDLFRRWGWKSEVPTLYAEVV